MQVKFADGDQIYQEPRHEDPLIYYLPAGDWFRSVGVEILPLYEEHKARAVTLRFWADNLERLQTMSDSELVLIIRRYVQTLSKHFSRWKELMAEFPDWLTARVGESTILQTFVDAGWQLHSRDTVSFRWER